MKCPTCGKEIAEDSKFCVYCGAEFIPVELKKEAKEVPQQGTSTHKNRFEGCPSIEGNAAPISEEEEPIKRHGFISFWLGLMMVINTLSVLKTIYNLAQGNTTMVLGVITMALNIVVIIAAAKLFKAEKLGFWMVLGVAIINATMSVIVSLAFGGAVGILAAVFSVIITLLSPLILWAILQIRKDGKSYWSQLK